MIAITVPKRIMIIDDDQVVRDVIGGVLAFRRIDCLAASGISEAQQILRQQGDVPVIVVDIHMPEMNGIEVIETLSQQVPKETAFIVLTSDIRQSTAVEAMRRKAFDFLRKPVDARDLIAAIDGAFQHVAEARAQSAVSDDLSRRHKELLDKAEKISAELLTSEGTLRDALVANQASDVTSERVRAPLNPLLSFSELLRKELEKEGAKGGLATADGLIEASHKLLSIFQTILDVYDADTGNLELDFMPIDIAPIIKRAVDPHRPKAKQKNLTLKLYVQSHLPRINGDKRRIAHILDQLVGNALKFSVDGGKIVVSAVHFDDDVILSVRDFGIGMAPDQIARALEPFSHQADEHLRSAESIGTGLTVAKLLTEMHGGRLELDSALGEGTTVRIHLPVLHENLGSLAA